MKKLKFSGLLVFLFLLISTSLPPPGDGKTAHKLHYKGTLFFLDGNYGRATGLFERAYGMEPENFNFALSLGLGLGRTGKLMEGLNVIKKARLSEDDPSYPQKLVLKLFFEGMINAYSGHFHKAIPFFSRSIELQEKLDEPEILSLMYNAMGYAILLNQGRGDHGSGDMGPHYHVHRRDMLKAVEQFELALENNGANEAALHNYQMLCDSLGLPKKNYSGEAEGIKALREGNTYANLPGSISRAIDFVNFDEVVFLLDISGSMVMEKVVCKGVSRFDVMKETMLLLLDEIAPETRVGIGTIGGDCGTEPKLWLPAAALSRKDLRRRIGFLAPDGTTPLLSMLHGSPELFSDSFSTGKAVFLVSDGANVCPSDGLDICEWSRTLLRQNITVNILTFLETNFSNTNAFAEYSCLTDNTNGRILYIDNYRCRLERYEFDLVETCQFRIPEFRRVECWGPAVKDLWAIFER